MQSRLRAEGVAGLIAQLRVGDVGGHVRWKLPAVAVVGLTGQLPAGVGVAAGRVIRVAPTSTVAGRAFGADVVGSQVVGATSRWSVRVGAVTAARAHSPTR